MAMIGNLDRDPDSSTLRSLYGLDPSGYLDETVFVDGVRYPEPGRDLTEATREWAYTREELDPDPPPSRRTPTVWELLWTTLRGGSR